MRGDGSVLETEGQGDYCSDCVVMCLAEVWGEGGLWTPGGGVMAAIQGAWRTAHEERRREERCCSTAL